VLGSFPRYTPHPNEIIFEELFDLVFHDDRDFWLKSNGQNLSEGQGGSYYIQFTITSISNNFLTNFNSAGLFHEKSEKAESVPIHLIHRHLADDS